MNSFKVDKLTISAIQKVITGDPVADGKDSVAPYRTGSQLVEYFGLFCDVEPYGQGFPARWSYTENKLNALNGTEVLKHIVEHCVEPRHFLNTAYSMEQAVDYLNDYLIYDGFRLELSGRKYVLTEDEGGSVSFDNDSLESIAGSREFIVEQINKCRNKLSTEDYDGAITNARSLLEAVLRALESNLEERPEPYKGDIVQLYKRVQKSLNLDPSRKDIGDSLKQVLSGMISIVTGIAPMRNKMSDSHHREYKPAKHHAKLAVNSAYTLSMFLVESYDYQVEMGFIEPLEKTK